MVEAENTSCTITINNKAKNISNGTGLLPIPSPISYVSVGASTGTRPFLGRCQWCHARGHSLTNCAVFQKVNLNISTPSFNPNTSMHNPQVHTSSPNNSFNHLDTPINASLHDFTLSTPSTVPPQNTSNTTNHLPTPLNSSSTTLNTNSNQHPPTTSQPTTRTRPNPKPNSKYNNNDFVVYTASALPLSVPTNSTQALKHPLWRKAMNVEFDALQHNQTWTLVPSHSHKTSLDANGFIVSNNILMAPLTVLKLG